jgi:hypothetical protein
MAIAALITWIVTALLGATMMTSWLRAGGASAPRAEGFPPAVVFGHFLLAAAGLLLWVAYLGSDATAWAWAAFVVLVLVAGLGDVLVLRWKRVRGSAELTAGAIHRPGAGGPGRGSGAT